MQLKKDFLVKFFVKKLKEAKILSNSRPLTKK